MGGLVWQNPAVEALRPVGGYRVDDVARVEHELERQGALAMTPLATGLFPAAVTTTAGTGYGHVWVRDNVWVAYAHHVRGRTALAVATARAVLELLHKHRRRFDAVIAGEVDPRDAMQRPHVRFDGATLAEVPERWAHAQNDALGYALWLGARLGATGALELGRPVVEMLSLLPRYFAAIRYWQDEDSGHWEEGRKRSASSIGTVVAGLEALVTLAHAQPAALRAAGFDARLADVAADLTLSGRAALETILPGECAQLSPAQNRRYDAALTFLVHPLGVVAPPLADQILADVDRYLTGSHGIRRYLLDSYWAPDYETHLPQADRTRDFSDDMAVRDALLDRIGDEAQWCIFDPMLSALWGKRYRETRARGDFERQVHHFERALAQITPGWRCPELYYLRDGRYQPNPHTPLLWTQANLSIALGAMHASVAVL